LRAKIEGGKTHLTGRFGVFAPGTVRAEFSDARGTLLASHDLSLAASPLQALVIKNTLDTPASAASVKLLWIGADGKTQGPLAEARLTDQ
jgi:hypothetical protein